MDIGNQAIGKTGLDVIELSGTDPAVFGQNRDQVNDALKQCGVIARKYFYPLTSESACYDGRFDPNETPVALAASRSVLTLPMYASLPLTDVDDICEIVAGCKK